MIRGVPWADESSKSLNGQNVPYDSKMKRRWSKLKCFQNLTINDKRTLFRVQSMGVRDRKFPKTFPPKHLRFKKSIFLHMLLKVFFREMILSHGKYIEGNIENVPNFCHKLITERTNINSPEAKAIFYASDIAVVNKLMSK